MTPIYPTEEDTRPHRERVKEILERDGVITNLWCLNHGIWRLSDVILHLRRDDKMVIDTEFNTPEVGKNCHYYLKKEPTQASLI